MVKEYENLTKEGILFENSQSEFIIEKFIEKGYPEDSFVKNWSIERNKDLDLVVLDPQKGDLLYVFEFKYWACDKKEFQNEMKNLVKKMNRKNYILPEVYVVVKLKKTNEIIYAVIDLEEETYKEVELAKIIKPMRSEQIILKNKEIQEKKIEKKESVKTLTKVSVSFGAVTLLVLILDVFGLIEMTSSRLLLYGAAILLFLLPFANKVKIASIEFEKEKKPVIPSKSTDIE